MALAKIQAANFDAIKEAYKKQTNQHLKKRQPIAKSSSLFKNGINIML